MWKLRWKAMGLKATGTMRLVFFAGVAAACLSAADKYAGPVPPKADVPYLMHAGNLIQTEVTQAREETHKDTSIATIPGANSPARTPLAEPIFILKADKLVPERISAYKLDVKNGNREVVISKRGRSGSKPIFLNVTRLGDGLYKIETDQILENGEYALSPDGSNDVFSFEVY